MPRVLRIRTAAGERELTPHRVGAAMREAREVAGLDLTAARRRLCAALGCTVLSEAILEAWERGAELPDAVQFLTYVGMAGSQAAQIVTGLLS